MFQKLKKRIMEQVELIRQGHQHRKEHKGRIGEFCHSHNMYEMSVMGAPDCFECGHQFLSDRDLLNAENDIRYKLIMAPVSHVEEVLSCPYCNHDL